MDHLRAGAEQHEVAIGERLREERRGHEQLVLRAESGHLVRVRARVRARVRVRVRARVRARGRGRARVRARARARARVRDASNLHRRHWPAAGNVSGKVTKPKRPARKLA